MIRRLFPFAVLALSAPAAMALGEPQPRPQVRVTGQVLIRERIIVRVPRMRAAYPVGRVTVAPPVTWKERKGPKCLDVGELAAAAIAVRSAVDLLLVDGRRVRAKLDRDCRSADFYSGLYIRPGADGRICADRDAIRVRSGATCEIDHFKLLTASR